MQFRKQSCQMATEDAHASVDSIVDCQSAHADVASVDPYL